jgi:glycine dehydrogenase subunit 1
MHRYLAGEDDRRRMLAAVGCSSVEELFSSIPAEVRSGELALSPGRSEEEVRREFWALAGRNVAPDCTASFLGAGVYRHVTPAVADALLQRGEFFTAYTPYQPEVAQGNLQAIYEYQTMICELTGMDAANASMYDGASALAEAALLMNGQTGREEILIPKTVHPFYRQVVRTYCHRAGIVLREIPMKAGVTDMEVLGSNLSDKTAGVLVQNPNFFGIVEPSDRMASLVHDAGGLFGVSVDPISLGVLKAPGDYGAALVTGEGQARGNPLNFGGPYVGIFAVKKPLIRRMPGRLVGVTQDAKGRRGFVLTLQTREQHIRREKATSSICTNEQLCALASAVYLSLMGKEGFPRVAELCLQKAHYLADALVQIPGVKLLFDQPFFKEFVIRTPIPPRQIIDAMRKEKIFAGINLSRFDYGIEDGLLVAVTEKRTREEMDRYAALLRKLIRP